MPKRSRKSVGTKEGGQAMLLLSGGQHLVRKLLSDVAAWHGEEISGKQDN